jgi:hypothetical protein
MWWVNEFNQFSDGSFVTSEQFEAGLQFYLAAFSKFRSLGFAQLDEALS